MSWPQMLQINAWAGAEVENRAPVDPTLRARILRDRLAGRGSHLFPTQRDRRHWSDPAIGWGLLLADDDALGEAERARGDDAPEPLRRLLAARGNAPVIRYRADGTPGMLRRYYADAPAQDLAVGAAAFGTARNQLPLYLLIYAPPGKIPWQLQYDIQTTHFTGRLDLEGEALDNYVNALIGDWAGSAAQLVHTLAWAADDKIGGHDITRLMRSSVASEVAAAWQRDTDLGPGTQFLDGATTSDATIARLMEVLAAHRPLAIVTTSHGKTSPLNDVPAMRADLGLPVDRARAILKPEALLATWQPDGAIWYAHACCSAGSDSTTAFDGLVDAGSEVDRILKGVAACGAMIAPLPRALLGAQKPLRAFIGHVEPTFDWSIVHRDTGQFMTRCLVETLYRALYRPEPVGMALDHCRDVADQLLNTWSLARERFIEAGEDTAGDLLAVKLMHNDWRSLVLLGDPTAMLPVPGG